jgi:hypothetical protein
MIATMFAISLVSFLVIELRRAIMSAPTLHRWRRQATPWMHPNVNR